MGKGVETGGAPREGKINLVASLDGLLKIDGEALFRFNIIGDVLCATLHSNSVVTKGQVVASVKALPLFVKKSVISLATAIAHRTSP